MKNEVLQTWGGFNIYSMHPIPGTEPVSTRCPALQRLCQHSRSSRQPPWWAPQTWPLWPPEIPLHQGCQTGSLLDALLCFLHLPVPFSCSHVSESLTWVTKEGEHSRWEAPRSWLPSTPPPSLPAPVPSRPGLSQVPDGHVLRPSCTCPPPGQSDAIRTPLPSRSPA